MDTLSKFKIRWKLISTKTEDGCVTSEYECKLPSKNSDRKYHMKKVETPQKVSRHFSII